MNELTKYVFHLYSKGASNFSEAMRMGAEIYQNLKSVVKKKYGIDGIFYKLILLLFSFITFPKKRDSSTCVWGTLWSNVLVASIKRNYLSFKSKFTYPLIFVTTPVQRGTTWNNVNLWFTGVCFDCDVTV